MLIGQSYTQSTQADVEKALGGWNDLPRNLAPATANDFYQLLSHNYSPKILFRQPRVIRHTWETDRLPVAPPAGSYDWKDVLLLVNTRLFVAPDFSGIMVVIDCVWNREKHPNPIMLYQPSFFSFKQCKHEEVERKQLGRDLERVWCKQCGFETEIDSGD